MTYIVIKTNSNFSTEHMIVGYLVIFLLSFLLSFFTKLVRLPLQQCAEAYQVSKLCGKK